MRTTAVVAVRLDRIEARLDRLERALADLQRLVGQSAGEAFAGTPPAMPLNAFLNWSKLTRRQYYNLRDKGVLRSIIVGERSVYVVLASYLDYIGELDRAQNGPDAPARQPVNPPPGRWGRQRNLGSLAEVASDSAQPFGAEPPRGARDELHGLPPSEGRPSDFDTSACDPSARRPSPEV
jgi:hypothetical protein